jgi:hypothetical protein
MLGAGPGGIEGTSFGGRTGASVKNCASAVAGNAATQAAKTSWAPLPILLPPNRMDRFSRPQSRQIQAAARPLVTLPENRESVVSHRKRIY